jgi:hypothetical protein
MSAEAAAAPARALSSLAGAVDDVSDNFVKLGHDLARVDNGRMISEARSNRAAAYSQFQLDLQKETDPQARLDRTNQFLADQKASMIPQGAAPVVREALVADFDTFSEHTLNAAAHDAAQLTTKRATLAFQNEIEEATRTGNREQYEAAKATASEALGLFPEQINALDSDFNRRSDALSLETHIMDDPLTAKELLESEEFSASYPHLDETDRRKAMKAATSALEEYRSEEMDILENSLRSGDLRPADIEAATYLSADDRKAFAHALTSNKAPDAETITKAWEITDQLRKFRDDPSVTDSDFRVMHNAARTTVLSMLPPDHAGDIRKELGYLSPAGRSSVDNEVKARPFDDTDLRAAARNQVKRALDAGMMGNVADDAPFAEKETAHRKAMEIRLEAEKFIRANPQATIDQVHQHTQNLLGGALDDNASLLDELPPAFSFDEAELDSFLTPIPGMSPGSSGSESTLLPTK